MSATPNRQICPVPRSNPDQLCTALLNGQKLIAQPKMRLILFCFAGNYLRLCHSEVIAREKRKSMVSSSNGRGATRGDGSAPGRSPLPYCSIRLSYRVARNLPAWKVPFITAKLQNE
jgi:hypothetical protein